MSRRKLLLDLLDEIDHFRTASWSARVTDIPKGVKYPYKFVLLKSLCLGFESAPVPEELMFGRLHLKEILPLYAKCLKELPDEFHLIKTKVDEVAQPISRLARARFWKAYSFKNRLIDFPTFTTQRINAIQQIDDLESLGFSHCGLPTKLRRALINEQSRDVLVSFINAKIADCTP